MRPNETPNSQTDFSELDPDFPEVVVNYEADTNTTYKNKGEYKNTLGNNDSVTQCDGFINQVREVSGSFYVKAGLIFGSSVGSGQDNRANITNVELRVGPTLKLWARCYDHSNKENARIRLSFTIRNLRFGIKNKENRSFLESRGTVETIKYGHID